MKTSELPYNKNSVALFQHIAKEEWAVFLDSGYPMIDSGRYDIIAARPWKTLLTYGPDTIITVAGNSNRSQADPFSLIQQHLGAAQRNLAGIPFCGGAIGYFAYDLGRRIEALPEQADNDIATPDMAIGFYDWCVIVDHHRRRSWLYGVGQADSTFDSWGELQAMFNSNVTAVTTPRPIAAVVEAENDKQHYAASFKRIKHYIRDGDCYQVNLAQRFSAPVSEDPWYIYQRLRQSNPAPFAGFMRLPDHAVLSSSPERFISVTNRMVETRPIKGTIRRSNFAYEDKALAEQLLESEKDRAENLMIVDLLRNDIGKSCVTGSVNVPGLFALESYASVHHLVSTVAGRLHDNKSPLDLLRGAFPGGSITGAPKLRAMQIIEELEPWRRKVYCGCMGYIGLDGNMDSNIAIRTMLHHDGRIYYWSGGGIVADSDLDSEYQECFTKAAAMSRIFQDSRIRHVGG
ncbi:MAG: aminodeoxychorismate synthase component I [Gammaproteobacteria bacterium]